MNIQKMIAGLDIGNGYVKGKMTIGNHTLIVDMPSTVTYTSGSDIPVHATDAYMEDIFNKLDVNINSKSIKEKDQGRIFVGTRGIDAGASQTEFNIDDHTPKCMDSLSSQLVLSSLAGGALKAYWLEHHELPVSLETKAVVALALPVEDYMQYKDVYRNMLQKELHYVHIHNFEKDITVSISVSEVVVLPEGAAGQYAITNLGADFLQVALDLARESGAKIDSMYTGQILSEAQNTIGVDIGEGTVNFPVFSGGDVSVEASSSINKGYGTVLNAVVSDLRNTKYAYESRKDLADFMLKDAKLPAQRYVQTQTKKAIDKQIPIFVRDVMKEYANVFRRVGLRTDVVYVYGGGANSVKDVLYPALIEASTLDGDYILPVIYMDSSYSRDLNRNGLYIAAKLYAESVGF